MAKFPRLQLGRFRADLSSQLQISYLEKNAQSGCVLDVVVILLSGLDTQRLYVG